MNDKRLFVRLSNHYLFYVNLSCFCGRSVPEVCVVVFADVGKAWCAGMDLKLLFRDFGDKPLERAPIKEALHRWRQQPLYPFRNPAIAIVKTYPPGVGRYN